MCLAALLLLAAGPVFAAPEVPDPELAVERGGFRLPSGIDIALTVQSQTAVNGNIVLRTVFAVDKGPATLTIYTPRAGETVAAPKDAVAASSTPAMPQVTYDGRNGFQVVPGVSRSTINVGTNGGSPLPEGLVAVDPAVATATDNGVVTRADIAGRQTVRLDGADLSIAHLAGTAFGSIIANTGSDRTIDTSTTLAIDLSNTGPDVLGSTMHQIDSLAVAAMTDRVR